VNIGTGTGLLRDINEFLCVLKILPVWVEFSMSDLHIMPLIVCEFCDYQHRQAVCVSWNNMHVCTMKTDLCTLSQSTAFVVFVSFMHFKRRGIECLLECKVWSFP
jgi:hypothetical protein